MINSQNLLIILSALLSGITLFSQIDPTERFIQLAQEAYNNEDFKNSLIAIDSALKYSPDDAGLYDSKSDLLLALKDFDAAGQIIDIALDKFPNDPITHCKKGQYHIFVGRPDDALKNYQDALSFATSDSLAFEIRTLVAVTKQDLRDFDGAKKELLDLYQIDDQNVNVLLSLGNVEEDLGNNNEALAYYKQALALDSINVGVLMNLGYLLQQEKRYSESYDYYEQAFNIGTTVNFLYYSNQSINLMNLDKDEQALDFINQSLDLNPYNSYAYRNKALILIKQTNLDDACSALDKAVQSNFTSIYGSEVQDLISIHCSR